MTGFYTLRAVVYSALLAAFFPAAGPTRAAEQEPNDPLVQMVVDLVNDADRDMRALGFQQVREGVPGEAATKQFTGMLSGLSPDKQAALVDALGDRGDPVALEPVLGMLGSKDEAVRVASLRALGSLSAAAQVPLLLKKTVSGTEAERTAARQSLIRLRDDSVNPALVAAFSSAGPDMLVELLSVVAARNVEEALESVFECAGHSEHTVRLAAIRAIRSLARERHAAKIVNVLRMAQGGAERREAELALLAVCGRGGQACVDPIQDGLAHADAAARVVLLRALARAGGPNALAAVEARLGDRDPAVRDEAVRMLSIWPDRAVEARLRRIAASAQNVRHQVLALRGLARLASERDDAAAQREALAKLAKLAGSHVPNGPDTRSPDAASSGSSPSSFRLVPIEIELPAPAFRGTPVPLDEPNVAKPRSTPRPPFLAPEGTANLARGKLVRSSDPAPAAGEIDDVTDGDKEASDFAYLELGPGTQWVQIDLGRKSTIYAVVVWHNHAEARVYRDVVVQIGDDPDLLSGHTVFNNDADDTSHLGKGRDQGYVETAEGKLIDCRGIEGRYVRLYSAGNHKENKNHYTEVEVYGRPVR